MATQAGSWQRGSYYSQEKQEQIRYKYRWLELRGIRHIATLMNWLWKNECGLLLYNPWVINEGMRCCLGKCQGTFCEGNEMIGGQIGMTGSEVEVGKSEGRWRITLKWPRRVEMWQKRDWEAELTWAQLSWTWWPTKSSPITPDANAEVDWGGRGSYPAQLKVRSGTLLKCLISDWTDNHLCF